jgi:hypothetical protein
VQLLGDAAILRGDAALDAYRVMTEGIDLVCRRDGIAPSSRLVQTVAALKAAALASQIARADTADIADVRDERTPRSFLRSGERVGVEEVARLLGVGHRQARRLAPSLGGRKTTRGWVFDLGLVQAYIDAEGKRST